MEVPASREKGGHFVKKNSTKHSALGNKALSTQPDWKGSGMNTEQTRPGRLKTVEDEAGFQSHPHKRPQPRRYMRFLPD